MQLQGSVLTTLMLLLYYHTNYKLIVMVAICAGPHNATGQV
jgi:hypothetical protein